MSGVKPAPAAVPKYEPSKSGRGGAGIAGALTSIV